MGDRKGKGKERGLEEASIEQSDLSSQVPSFISQVAASAGGLARNVFTAPPNSNDLNQSATTAFSSTGKGQPSSSSNGASTWAENAAPSFQSQYHAGRSAIRAGHSEQHVAQSENDFSSFLNGIDSFTPSKLEDDNSSHWPQHFLTQPIPLPSSTTVAQQELQDGQDVLAILSAPSSEPFEAPPTDDDDFDWGLNATQLANLRSMTTSLFPPIEPHHPVSPSNPMNLGYDDSHADIQDLVHEINMLGPGDEQRLGMLRARLQEMRGQWEDVLTRYTDEVWGNALPLVKEARQEVKSLGQESQDSIGNSGQLTALRRLQAILGHVRRG